MSMDSGFTYPDGSIEIRLSGKETPAYAVALVLHELAHSTTGKGHGPEWWREAKRLYSEWGVLDTALMSERSYAEVWD